ncbi:hypothetical protein [Nonomuraea rubra]|uniref:Uncharacterized protein n=1 Tax=Nonomuraea rubra TaxID=46180 RepID=A0A7X0U6H7_9ACTN|nr:hypothetical protein [Nonomuraea rubra]MBB6557087.1 hypothetical protein [Nonomuraea rubra]
MNKRKRAAGSAVFVDHSGRRAWILTISGILAGTLLLALTAVLLGSAFRGIRLDSVQWPADGRGGGGAPEQSESADVTSPSPAPSASVRSRRPSAPPSAPASRRPSAPVAEDTPDRPAPSPSPSRTTRPAVPDPEDESDEPAGSIGGEQDPGGGPSPSPEDPAPSQSETAEASTAPTGDLGPSPGGGTESPAQLPDERPGAASGRNT